MKGLANVAGLVGLSSGSGFDLTTLDTSARFATNGSLKSFPAPANGGNGSVYWIGTPSAGTSNAHAAWIATTLPVRVTGPALNGFPTLNLLASTAGGRDMRVGPETADGSSGGLLALPATYTDHLAAGLLAAGTGSLWALINPNTAAGGGGAGFDDGVWGPHDVSCIQLGTGKAEVVKAVFAGFFVGTIPLNAWSLLQLRYSGGSISGRINGGAWTALATAAFAGTYFGIGQADTSGVSMDAYGADFGASPTFYDDPTFDKIYSGIKALYPGAALP